MLKFFHKNFDGWKKKICMRKGQVSIVLILVIATALIFYAISLNFGLHAIDKTVVQIAATSGAAKLVSQMASYGQYLYRSQLNGHTSLCGLTALGHIVMTLAIIFTWGLILLVPQFREYFGISGGWGALKQFFLTYLFGGLMILMALMQIPVDFIMVSKWNQMQKNGMTQVDQFVESGLQAALIKAASDSVKVPDLYDEDQDTLFGFDLTTNEPKDEINRFDVYYTKRLEKASLDVAAAITKFYDDLEEFLYEGTDAWGITDPVGCAHGCCYHSGSNPDIPTECNVCCLPPMASSVTADNPLVDDMNLQSPLCDCVAAGSCTVDQEVGVTTTCGTNSVYPDTDTRTDDSAEGYRYDFDPFMENGENSFFSFRELLGTDDEQKDAFFKNKRIPNRQQFRVNTTPSGAVAASTGVSLGLDPLPSDSGDYTRLRSFRIQDTTGYYRNWDRRLFEECETHCNDADPVTSGYYCELETQGGPLPVYPQLVDAVNKPYYYSYPAVSFAASNCAAWLPAVAQNKARIKEDYKKGVFGFFYKISDWGLDLNALDFNTKFEQCQWFDSLTLPAGVPHACAFDPTRILPAQLRMYPMALPHDPTTLSYNITRQVDGKNLIASGKTAYLKVDNVHIPANIPFEAPDTTVCAQDAFTQPNPTGFWKRGGDRFCASEDIGANDSNTDQNSWQYALECTKAGLKPDGTYACTAPDWDVEDGDVTPSGPCECQDSAPGHPPEEYPEDVLDDIVYGMQDLIVWAQGILSMDKRYFVQTFFNWYSENAHWIEPGDAEGAQNLETANFPCYECREDASGKFISGGLWEFRRKIQQIKDRLIAFRDFPFSTGMGCDDAWCNFPAGGGGCTDIPSGEKATISTGKLSDVVACLDYNVNYSVAGATGNAERFKACHDACTALVPAVDAIRPPNTPAPTAAEVNNVQALATAAATYCPADTNTVELPRSLVHHPGVGDHRFDPTGEFVKVEREKLKAYIACEQTCDTSMTQIENCVNDASDPTSCISVYNTDFASCQSSYGVANAAACAGLANPASATACTLCFQEATDDFDACETSCRSVTPTCPGPGPEFPIDCKLANFNNLVNDGLTQTMGSCNDTVPGGVVDLLNQSIPEAENQVVKFRKRWSYLKDLSEELDNIIDIFQTAQDKFEDFLLCSKNGAVCDLIKHRFTEPESLPYQIVYGWRDEGPTDPPKELIKNNATDYSKEGFWHIVKVEARVPQKCDNACSTTQEKDKRQGWPYIKAYTKDWGMKKCYKLARKSGTVKMRVTRWDEVRPSKYIITFPNGMPIWNFKRKNPQKDVVSASGLDPRMLSDPGKCGKLKVLGPATRQDIYEGAFMLNDRVANADPLLDNTACWDLSHLLLSEGVSNEVCAQYYWSSPDKKRGFAFKFVPCQNFL